jgi:histidine ammonia-lyase
VTTLVLGGGQLGVAELVEVARAGRRLAFSPAARRRIVAQHRLVELAVAGGQAVYGVTTGLGSRVTQALAHEALAERGAQIVRGRAHALGEALPTEVVRGALAARCASLAHGGSGISPAVAELLLELCNRNVHPVIPSLGSVGASDLCQMAHVGLVVIGEGSAEQDGNVLSGAEALRRAGLVPAALEVRDGLALCSSSAVTLSQAALGLHDVGRLLGEIELAASCSFEGFRANTNVLHPGVQQARPAPGQGESARRLLELLAGSDLVEAGVPRRLQDPVSFRCLPQVHGALRAALALLGDAVLAELNGAPDNPLVLGDDAELRSEADEHGTNDPTQAGTRSGRAVPEVGSVVPSGNFHTAALGLGLETTSLALARVAGLSTRRAQRLLSARVSGLPERLVAEGAQRSGFGPLMKVAHALLGDVVHLATPVPVIAEMDSEAEDDASTAPWAARRLRAMLPLVHRLAAIEALVACQAVELAAPARIAEAPRQLLAEVRNKVPPLLEDRPLAGDVEIVAETLEHLARDTSGPVVRSSEQDVEPLA